MRSERHWQLAWIVLQTIRKSLYFKGIETHFKGVSCTNSHRFGMADFISEYLEWRGGSSRCLAPTYLNMCLFHSLDRAVTVLSAARIPSPLSSRRCPTADTATAFAPCLKPGRGDHGIMFCCYSVPAEDGCKLLAASCATSLRQQPGLRAMIPVQQLHEERCQTRPLWVQGSQAGW